MFTSMKDGVNSTIGNITTSIENGIDGALTFLASLPSKAWSYGADFVNGIVNGIKSAMGKVEDAVSGLAAKIRSYLHFSVPDEGPLTDYESWMPDFMSGLADGINKSKTVVSQAIKGLSLDMSVNTKLATITTPKSTQSNLVKDSNSGSGLTLKIENFINNTEKDIEQLAYELEFYRQKISMGKGGV
jgi:phage-related protein